MSIYHRRVYLKGKKPACIQPCKQLQSSSSQTSSQQSTHSTSNQIPGLALKAPNSSKSPFVQKLTILSNNQAFSIFMSILTIYTIFAIDIDKAFFNVTASTYFSSIHCVAIGLFVMEILLLSIVKRDTYFLKFYFWIDCFSTLTMFLEIIWIQNLMSTSSDVTVALSFAKVTKASRLSKIGARSSKIMKLIRLVKLMKFFQKQDKKEGMNEGVDGIKEGDTNFLQNCIDDNAINEQSNYECEQSYQNVLSQRLAKRNKTLIQQDPSNEQSSQSQQSSNTSEQNSSSNNPANANNLTKHPNLQTQQQISEQIQRQPQSQHTSQSYTQKYIPFVPHPNQHSSQILPTFNQPHLNIPEETIHHHSVSQSHDMMSEDDKNNLEEIMRMFFVKNMDRFVEQGKSNKVSKKWNDIDGNEEQGTEANDKITNVVALNDVSFRGPDQNNPNPRHTTVRPSARLSFIKRKQLMEMSRSRQHRDKASRFNNNFTGANMNSQQAPFANIVEKLQKSISLQPLARPNVNKEKQQALEKKYKQLLERLKEQSQPKKVLQSQNLKVGQVLKQQIQKNIVIMVMGLIMILPIITADTWFDQNMGLNINANLFIENITNIPTLQGQTQLLQSFIATGLEMTTPLQYFNIPINQTCCQYPLNFPRQVLANYVEFQDLRLSQQTIVMSPNLTIVFSKKQQSQVTSYLNLGRSLFITLLLVFCSVLFMKDIQNYALNPLQKMSSLINKISQNPFEALKQINQEKKKRKQGKYDDDEQSSTLLMLKKTEDQEQQNLQTNILSNVIIKITSLLTIGAGQIGSEIISHNIQSLGQEQTTLDDTFNNTNSSAKQLQLAQSQIAVYSYVKIRGFDQVCDIFGDQVFKYVNRLTEIIHETCIQMGGVPIDFDGKGFLLLWKPKQDIVLEDLQQAKQKAPTKNFNQSSSQCSLNNNCSQSNNVLTNLALLALNATQKLTLQINKLEQARKFYQYMLQKCTSEHNPDKYPLFQQNYEPHLVVSSIHVGQSFYGSMGSQFKLQCKCIGYDVAFTKYLAEIVDEEGYGVGNILSEDVWMLIEECDTLKYRLNGRKLDTLKIKQIRHKDFLNNHNITFMNSTQLKTVPCSKSIHTQIFTCDFSGKLQPFSSNQSQLMNMNTLGGISFNLNKTHQLSQKSSYKYDRSMSNEKYSNKSHNNLSPKTQAVNLHSFSSLKQEEEENSTRTLAAYLQREKFLGLAGRCGPQELLSLIEAEYTELRQSRATYEKEFYQNWSDALECYYSLQFQQALGQLKFLHTFNQTFNDQPSKIFINRIQTMTQEQIQLLQQNGKRNFNTSGNNSRMFNGESSSDQSQWESNSRKSGKSSVRRKKWTGANVVVWRI